MAGMTCGAGGTAYKCGVGTCTPATCEGLNVTCGTPPDGCGGTLASCGTCRAPDICGGGFPAVAYQCGCPPNFTQCPSPANCGTETNSCGTTFTCGSACTAAETCGGISSQGDTPNVCCKAATAAALCVATGGQTACGLVSDGCGGDVNCGTCTPPKTCSGGNGKAGVCQ